MTTDPNILLRKSKSLMRRARAALVRPTKRTLSTYQSDFAASAETFLHYLKRVNFNFPPATGKLVGVVIAPTVGTTAPWFFTMIAIGLRRQGRHVILIHDDIEFEFPTSLDYYLLQQKHINYVLNWLEKYFPVRRTSAFAPQALREDDTPHLEWLVDLNMRWWRRAGPVGQNLDHIGAREQVCFENHLARSYTLFDEIPFEYIVTVGGLVGPSASFLRSARRHGARFVTCDGTFGCLFACPDGNAALQADLTRAFQEFWETAEPAEKDFAVETAKREFRLRVHGRDKLQFQATAKTGSTTMQADVLIPLNVEWDSSALGRHTIFEDSREWLRESVKFILAQNKSVIVRQHPSERRDFGKSDFDPPTLLGPEICAHPNYHWVAAADPINTYDVLDITPLVLTYVSTIGVEAAGMGKHVIAVGDSYYAPLGFVRTPSSREEYFEWITQALNGTLPMLPEQAERAWITYYLGQVCNRIYTDFTPQPSDFWKWSKVPAARILNDPAIKTVLTSIEDNVPVSLLNHRIRWKTQE